LLLKNIGMSRSKNWKNDSFSRSLPFTHILPPRPFHMQ
jgi:hypothetical protein